MLKLRRVPAITQKVTRRITPLIVRRGLQNKDTRGRISENYGVPPKHWEPQNAKVPFSAGDGLEPTRSRQRAEKAKQGSSAYQFIYDKFFRRNAVYLSVFLGGAAVVNVAYEEISDQVWDGMHKGKSFDDVLKRFPNLPPGTEKDDEDEEPTAEPEAEAEAAPADGDAAADGGDAPAEEAKAEDAAEPAEAAPEAEAPAEAAPAEAEAQAPKEDAAPEAAVAPAAEKPKKKKKSKKGSKKAKKEGKKASKKGSKKSKKAKKAAAAEPAPEEAAHAEEAHADDHAPEEKPKH